MSGPGMVVPKFPLIDQMYVPDPLIVPQNEPLRTPYLIPMPYQAHVVEFADADDAVPTTNADDHEESEDRSQQPSNEAVGPARPRCAGVERSAVDRAGRRVLNGGHSAAPFSPASDFVPVVRSRRLIDDAHAPRRPPSRALSPARSRQRSQAHACIGCGHGHV